MTNKTKTIVGAQWGDEGKGKIIDWLCDTADVVVRFQGGNNAGHTIVSDGKTYKLSLLPSGIITNKFSLIGSGVVVNTKALFEEIETIKSQGISISPTNLGVSHTATLILPYHIALDKAREQFVINKIGTTQKGIGPAYEDRVGRRAIRVVDLLCLENIESKLEDILFHYNVLLSSMDMDTFSVHEIMSYIKEYCLPILPFMVNDTQIIQDNLENNSILFEGAQAIMLDVNHGTYPYVTSSNTVSAQTSIGTGYGYPIAGDVIGVAKAYCTRVGGGPFVTELESDIGDILCKKGKEYGTVTGRKRRCGWLDIVSLKHAILAGGITSLAITKADIMDEFEHIKICICYSYKGKLFNNIPFDINLDDVTPIYLTLPGWQENTYGITEYNKLPEKYKVFLQTIEKLTNIPVKYLSTGPDREHTFQIV